MDDPKGQAARTAAHKAGRGKKTKDVMAADFNFDQERGFFVEAKDKTRKQRSKENKARFAKLSPEEKAATKGDAPFHPEA